MEHSKLVTLVLAITCGLVNFQSGQTLKIQVVDVDGGKVEKEFSDSSAAFQERSYLIPTKREDAIQGLLIYPNPRNACSTVDPPPNDTFIAFLEEYGTCSGDSETNLQGAGFSAFITFSSDKNAVLVRKRIISQALFLDANFASYLKDNVVQTPTNASWDYEVVIWDDSFAKLEQLFIIFGAILLVAVFLSIGVFCFSLCCRMAMVRWRTRGLSNWQVRALPKRKFRQAKETVDTCSICLEEFKEGETVRVLPCDHVFHPKCVDEWLRKWNRTCPLCKSTIKRNGGRAHNPPAQTDDNEASLLLPQEERVSLGSGRGRDYGTTGATSVLHKSGSNHAHRRGGSGSSNCSSGAPARNTNQVTSAEIELSTGTELSGGSNCQTRSNSPASLYETPLNSDMENTPSYTTAYSSNTEQV